MTAKAWALYDEILNLIPRGLKILECVVGQGWTAVQNEKQTGIAMSVRASNKVFGGGIGNRYDEIIGADLVEIAKLIKSWNFLEASIGAAAINSYFNSPELIHQMGGFPDLNLSDTSIEERTKKDAFASIADQARGKNVTVVGHFPHLEEQLAPICNLSILERVPFGSDYPDPAAEYILEMQDYVLITGMTFINKTLPRLLELKRTGAIFYVVGPSIPACTVLKDYGVDRISGFCVREQSKAIGHIKAAAKREIFDSGHMFEISF